MNREIQESCMSDITLAQFLLKCQFFPALFHKDKEKDKYQIIKSDDKVSKYMFPMIVQVIKCGSRAEQIYLESSDIDYMYEVGPLLVGRKRFKKKTFYFDITNNPGFYTVCDEEGGYLHPMALQSRFATVIHGVKQVASLEKTSATLPSITSPPETLQHISNQFGMARNEMENYNQFGMQHNQIKINEDSVIALKCQEWPKDIWKKFKKRKLGHVNMQQLKGTPLHLIPKAHPDSKKPWLEWRLSFSLVEKKIFESVPYIFHKVYLHCKSLTRIWKGKYNFPSYVLKTVFLWNYEDWQKSENEFTEDGILEMILQLFINLYEYYKEGVLPMYFIPEVNLLAQYSKTEQENIITELKALANLQSLSSSICKNSSKPFCQISVPYIHFTLTSCSTCSSDFMQSSYCNLRYLYGEKIHQNKGITDNEDKLEFLHELYVTFLLLLVERVWTTDYCYRSNNLDLINYLYYLMVHGNSYIPNDISCGVNNFIVTYTASVNEFLSVYFPNDKCKFIRRLLSARAFYLDEKTKLETQRILCKRYKEEELAERWINGDFDNHDILIVHEMYRFGNKRHSENLHKHIIEDNFSKFDSVFKSIVNKLNSYFSRSFKSRCFKEIEMKTAAYEALQKNFFLGYLVQDMFEMYSYGFTDGKFHLPTPAVYMSYLRQLMVNVTCKLQNHYPDFYWPDSNKNCIIDGTISDQWGFFVKGNYVTYHQRNATAIPFN